MQNGNAKEIYKLINEGMHLTYPEFDMQVFKAKLFMYEEANLLHTLARTFGGDGRLDDAIQLLDKIYEGLEKLPTDNKVKESKQPQILLTLAEMLLRKAEYAKALPLCEKGQDISVKRNQGRLTPTFMFYQATCQFYLGNQNKCPNLLKQDYFGYRIMEMKSQAAEMLATAQNLFGVKIETYGTEHLQPRTIAPQARHGGAEACKTIGGLLKQFKEEQGIKANTIYQGICTASTYNRIEKGKIQQPDVYEMEALMQRLGRDPDKYYNIILIKDEFDDKQTRDNIMTLLVAGKTDDAEKLLNSIKNKKAFKNKPLGKQFVASVEASVYRSRNGYTSEYEKRLLSALEITLPHYEESCIFKQRLTHREINIITQLACYYAGKKDNELDRGLEMFRQLRESVNKFYVDGHEMVRTYVTVLYHYSKYLGLAKQYHKALAIIEEGEQLCLSYKRIRQLPGFAVNKACDLLELGKEEESVPYFAMAYYGSALIKRTDDQKITGKYVSERLGITFD